jgi:hypothetical protein
MRMVGQRVRVGLGNKGWSVGLVDMGVGLHTLVVLVGIVGASVDLPGAVGSGRFFARNRVVAVS